MKVAFYEQWEAFTHSRRDDNALVVTVATDEDHFAYEFMIMDEGTAPGSRERIGLRVMVFDDAWDAFGDLPDLFAALRAQGPDRSLADARELLASLGYTDRTDELATQDQHTCRCACGATLGAAV